MTLLRPSAPAFLALQFLQLGSIQSFDAFCSTHGSLALPRTNPTVDHENEWPANGSSRTFQGYGSAHRENEHNFKARKARLISWQYFIVGKCREVEFKILSLTFRASVGCFTKHLHAPRIHQGLLELTLSPAKDFYNLSYLPSCCEYFNLSIYFLKTAWFLGQISDAFSCFFLKPERNAHMSTDGIVVLLG